MYDRRHHYFLYLGELIRFAWYGQRDEERRVSGGFPVYVPVAVAVERDSVSRGHGAMAGKGSGEVVWWVRNIGAVVEVAVGS